MRPSLSIHATETIREVGFAEIWHAPDFAVDQNKGVGTSLEQLLENFTKATPLLFHGEPFDH